METTIVTELTDKLTALDFTPITDVILVAVGVGLPVAISVLAIKKGIAWVKGMVRGA